LLPPNNCFFLFSLCNLLYSLLFSPQFRIFYLSFLQPMLHVSACFLLVSPFSFLMPFFSPEENEIIPVYINNIF
jgi:hypothetical protein